MKTVKAKIKGTNAILEGCVCDDSFFVSVDHDIFERYALCEVEICKDSFQVPETCKENMDSLTDDLDENNRKTRDAEVILNGHGLLVDVTKWADGYKLKVIVKEE